ncbi:hypothetical protein [Mucilaginibacter flavidus]|uniref:hypothetical protein n=1 Tax=Mucilaginibacter flavidus TaxID=2949309 RepID=UPI002092108A|nr:hypothetical protein [Mucilaginibacter flavidus]MCO5948010.1 hypothetical protein [Mucilaginibacter flavidus]
METTNQISTRTIQINRPCYIAFTAAGIIFFILHDFSQASVFFGLGLVFDPFDLKQPFPQRPFYQRALLVVQLILVMTLLILSIIK